jgi:hypothetical protein
VRGLGAEDDRLALCLDPAPRSGLAEIPGADVRPQGGVRIAHLLDRVLRGLRSKTGVFQLGVGVLAQLVLPRHAAVERHLRHPVGSLVDRAQGRADRQCLHGIRHQPHLHNDLHTAHRNETLRQCEEVMRVVCADFETELVEFNGERDHVHLHPHHPPKVSISKLVGSLKGVSARRLRHDYPDHIRNYL